MADTVLDAISQRLKNLGTYNENAFVGPTAILWPDEARQWGPVVDRLKAIMPIIELGELDEGRRCGPAYWIRCAVAGTVDVSLPAGLPVIYMPGVGRGAVRAVEACPSEIAPIAELQYRSNWFAHDNGRDWTLRAFLHNPDKGLGLSVAEDKETAEALGRAVEVFLGRPFAALSGQNLDAAFFNELLNPDHVRSLLDYLNDPAGFADRIGNAKFEAFAAKCKADYKFNPKKDGEIAGARLLAERSGSWKAVWDRFAENPGQFEGVHDQLRKAKSDATLFDEHWDAWPQDNDSAEDQLRARLRDLAALTPSGARNELQALESEHGRRRSTVWAKVDYAPLAFALEHLTKVAEVTKQPVPSGSVEEIRADYTARAWMADDAVLRAIQAAPSKQDRDAVLAAIEAIYRSWLDAGAKALQEAIGPLANSNNYIASGQVPVEAGVVTVFVDGLRLDAGHRLSTRLEGMGFTVSMSTGMSALPTVTETAKAALVPIVAGALVGGSDLHAARAASGARANQSVLALLAGDRNVEFLSAQDIGSPMGSAWTDAGRVDHRGHDEGIGLADHLDNEVDEIAGRIRALLRAGWQRVEVVTDHGWLLMPGGLPKVELLVALTETKKGRCARIKDGASVDVPTVPWYWDKNVTIAVAPGIGCFEAGKDYEHGGISPQECIVPRLTVSQGPAASASSNVAIKSIRWLRMLCRIELEGVAGKVIADVRALAGDPATSIAEAAKDTLASGQLSLLVGDEDLEGQAAYVVIVDSNGAILAQRDVVVGRNS